MVKFLIPEENDKICTCFQFGCTYQIQAALQKQLSPSLALELGDPEPDRGETSCPTPSHHPAFAGELAPDDFRPFSGIPSLHL